MGPACKAPILDRGVNAELLPETLLVGAGGFNVASNNTTHLTGIGDHGNGYIDNSLGKFSQRFSPGETVTRMSSGEFISEGTAPNFLLSSFIRMTITPDGNLAVSITTGSSYCVG